MYILYFILLFIIIIFIIFKLYIKIKYKFWANQPVFHKYNLYYRVFKRGIINKELPKLNRYCNFYNIIVDKYEEVNDNIIKEIVELLKRRVPPNKQDHIVTSDIFSSYFIGCNNKSFISIYRKNNPFIFNIPIKSSSISPSGVAGVISQTESLSPCGVITSRPLNVTFKNNISFQIYFIDFLYVHTDYINTEITEELIQTHEYTQRYKNLTIKITLFKQTKPINGIIPLTTYKIYKFNIQNIPNYVGLHASMQILEINKLNITLLTSLIYTLRNKLECFIIPDLLNLLNLINNNIYKIYGIIVNDILISCYFFRMQNDSIECFASIMNCSSEIFLKGFLITIKKLKINELIIENISFNNNIINKFCLLNIIPISITSVSYYFYNYIKNTILPDKIFILI